MGFIHTMAIPGSKVFWLLLAILGVIIHVYAEDYSIGIDYGQLGDNLPSTEEAIHFIQIMKAGRVKLYDANPEILKSLSHTGIKVSVMVKNEDIANVSASQSVADKWVKNNVVYFYPATKINIVLVGNEILSDYSNNQTWYQLVPAMLRIRRALLRYKLHHIKQLDAVVAAMSKLGYEDIRLSIAETGWPNDGDLNQLGANIFNAAHYNRRLIRRMLADPPLGTPRRPNQFIPTYIFSLFNEDQKPGPGTERHWGLLYPNGSRVYEIDLTGELQDSEYKPLPPPPPPYTGKLWCVVNANANVSSLPSATSYACSQGNNTCAAIQPGKPCYQPNTVIDHASYAFNSYWQQFKNSGGTCYFNGAATLVTQDPSRESCRYPST